MQMMISSFSTDLTRHVAFVGMCRFVPHLSGEEDGRVKVLWMPLARRVEELLPGAEVPQGHPSVAGDLGADFLVLHHQHPHYHHVD